MPVTSTKRAQKTQTDLVTEKEDEEDEKSSNGLKSRCESNWDHWTKIK